MNKFCFVEDILSETVLSRSEGPVMESAVTASRIRRRRLDPLLRLCQHGQCPQEEGK